MDYSGQLVTPLLRGPLLHTPQGIAVLVFSAIYLLLGALFAFADLPPPPGWRATNIIGFCLTCPSCFSAFREARRTIVPPLVARGRWLACCALAPVFFTLWKMRTV